MANWRAVAAVTAPLVSGPTEELIPVPGSRISVVVNTLNEAKRLPFALRSVRAWADEIVVVDMKSDDATQEIARSMGATLVETERLGYVEPGRALGVEASTGDWILILDADEVVPAPLSRELCKITREDRYDVVVIPWLNYLLGSPLMHSGWGPHQDKHVRFFRRGSVSLRPEIHQSITPSPSARIFEIPYREGLAVVHFNYIGVSQFVEKTNTYTTVQARQVAAQPGRHDSGVAAALVDSAKAFFQRYLGAHGYQDGWRGATLSIMMAMYVFITAAKVMQIQRAGTDDEIEARYREQAERILLGYGGASAPTKDEPVSPRAPP